MQYRGGSVTVVNGSATVVFADALTGAEQVAIGHRFKTDRDGDAIYQLASRTPSSGGVITEATLSAPFGGLSAVGLAYQIVSDFTVIRGYPRPNQGDFDAGDWIAAALDMIDADIGASLGTGAPSLVELGSVIFRGPAGFAGATTSLFWDQSTLRFGVGTATPSSKVTVEIPEAGVDGIAVVGATGSRPLLKVFDGTITLQLDSSEGAPRIWTDGAALAFYESTIWRMAIDGGRLLIGTSDMSDGSAAAGEIVLKNGKRYRALDAAGTSARALIGITSGDYIEVAGDGNQVKIGTPLVPIGTGTPGAVATLGPVGGAGPQSTAQAAWEPFIDSTGAQKFRPVYE